MSTQVYSIVNRNPTFSPNSVDSPPDSIPIAFSREHDNLAPEDKTDPSSHTYAELPGLQNGNSRRRVANPIYDSADPYTGHSTKYQEPVQPYKESKLGRVFLFVILLISIAALVLVVMIILGKLVPACSCDKTGSPSTSKLQETQSNVNLDKITEALNSLKKKMSEVETKLNKKISDLRNELNDAKNQVNNAKNQIQTLQRDNDNAALWRQFNETRDKLNVHEKTHDAKYEQCVVRFDESPGTDPLVDTAKQQIEIIEETGKKILHYSCSTNNADIVQRLHRVNNNKNHYSCLCLGRGTYSYTLPSLPKPDKMYCYITYTECPLIS